MIRFPSLLRVLLLGIALQIQPLSAEPPSHVDPPKHAAPSTSPAHDKADGGTSGSHEQTHEKKHAGLHFLGMEFGDGGQWVLKLINATLFFGGIFLLLRGALSASFRARREEIEQRLQEAAREKTESQAQLKALEVKMASLESELQQVSQRASQEAESERERILALAQTEAEAILAQAQAEITSKKQQAEQELRALVAELASQGAADRLRVLLRDDLAQGILDRSIEQIGEVR